ncbi:MAG: flagellar biosynthetic protein FliO [Dissulfurispiraceae bacterium]
MGIELVKVFAALLVTLAAVYLLLRLLKQKMLPHKGMIEMLHYQSFGPKKGIAVIKILNDYMAVGIGDQGISLLSKLNREGVEEALKSQSTENIVQKTKQRWLRAKGNG